MTVGDNNLVKIWDSSSFSLLRAFEAPGPGRIQAAKLDRTGERVVIGENT